MARRIGEVAKLYRRYKAELFNKSLVVTVREAWLTASDVSRRAIVAGNAADC